MFSKSFLDELLAKVQEVEAKSSVELVVVASPFSGSYRELRGWYGSALVIALLMLAIYSPWTYHPEYLLGGVVFAYCLGYYLIAKLDGLNRLVTLPNRRQRQVESQANDVFMRKRVGLTRGRTGLLLYISGLERRIRFVPDVGIQRKVPAAVFNELESSLSQAPNLLGFEAALLKALSPLADCLGEALPRKDDDEDELPNEVWLMEAKL